MGGSAIQHTSVVVKKLHPAAQLPVYGSAEAAGADLVSVEEVTIPAGGRKLLKTGLAIELQPGYQAEIRPRSGLALKQGITVLNTPGTVDSDYRGEVGVILFNTADTPFVVFPGDRIAQMVIMPVVHAGFAFSDDELSTSGRGEGGFGSTGV